jgi:hypothetical protein
MKELTDIIKVLQKLDESIVTKDNALTLYNKLNKILLKFLNDDDLKNSEVYNILKLKYLTEMSQLLQNINNEQFNIVLEPSKNIIIKNKDVEKDPVKIPISCSYDQYQPINNNLSKIKLVVKNKKQVKKIQCYQLIIDKSNYLYDHKNNIIYSFEKERVGHISDDTIYINDSVYMIKSLDSFECMKSLNYMKINSNYIIVKN